MGFLELTDVAYRLPGGWTLFEGVDLPGPRGRPLGARRRQRDRQDHAAAPDRGRGARRAPGRSGSTAGSASCVSSSARPSARPRCGSSCSPTASPRCARPPRGSSGAEERLAADPDERAQLAYAEALARVGDRRRLPRRGAVGSLRRTRRSAAGTRSRRPADRDVVGRRAQAAGAGDRARARRSTSSLLDEPDNTLDIDGKEWLEDADPRGPTHHPVRLARPHGPGARRDADRHARGARDLDAPRGVRAPTRRPATPASTGSTSSHRRYDEERQRLDRDGQGDEAQGRVQRRLGVEGALGGTSPRAVRGARAAAREGGGAGRPDARRRRVGPARSRSARVGSRSPGSSPRSTPRCGSASGSG